MNYRVLAERTVDGSLQIWVNDRLIPQAELQAALATVDATVTDANAVLRGSQLFCNQANKVSHVFEFGRGYYSVVPGLQESKDLLGPEAFARVLAGGRLHCPNNLTVDRDAISENAITAGSKLNPKLLACLDVLGNLNFVLESKKALAKRGLTARLPTSSEMRQIGKEIKRREFKYDPQEDRRVFTLDNGDEPFADLESILQSGQLTNRLGCYFFYGGTWSEYMSPRTTGVPVLVVSEAK